MKHRTTGFRICACAILFVAIALAPASSQNGSDKTSSNKEAYASDFLNALASIPDWATQLGKNLEAIGNEIDQRKAKQALIPYVVRIQDDLSEIEKYNQDLVNMSSEKDVNRSSVSEELMSIAEYINGLDIEFGELRKATQAISIPELTDLERASEGLVVVKRRNIQKTISELGYKDKAGKLDLDAVRQQSKQLLDLLHQAQDSFGKLHQMLSS